MSNGNPGSIYWHIKVELYFIIILIVNIKMIVFSFWPIHMFNTMTGDFGLRLCRTDNFGDKSVISDGDFGRCAVKSDGDFGQGAVNSDAAVNSDGDFGRCAMKFTIFIYYITILVLISLILDGSFGRWFRTVISDGDFGRRYCSVWCSKHPSIVLFYMAISVLISVISDGDFGRYIYKEAYYYDK